MANINPFIPYWNQKDPNLTIGKSFEHLNNDIVSKDMNIDEIVKNVSLSAGAKYDDDYDDSNTKSTNHHDYREKDFAETIILQPGYYKLNKNLNNSVAINFVSTAYFCLPNVVISSDHTILSYGNKSWQGCIFKKTCYILNNVDSEDRFVNCYFKDGFTLKINNGKVNILNCKTIIKNLNQELIIVSGESSLQINNSSFECCVSGDDKANSLIKFNGFSYIPNIINNCIFTLDIKSRSETCSKPFNIFQLGSTQPLYYNYNLMILKSCNNQVIVFGNTERINGIQLIATYNIYNNDNINELFISLLGNVWSSSLANNQLGSIFISHSTLRHMRLLRYSNMSCSLCVGINKDKETCTHNNNYTSWDQGITITYTNVILTTSSINQKSAIIDLNGPSGTIWLLNLPNNTFTVNNDNIPISINNIQSARLNLQGSIISNDSLSTNASFLTVSNVPGGIILNTNAGTSVTGLQPPIIDNSGSVQVIPATSII